jgi:3-oxoacyl-[acyl-carrier-protein] synthase-3
MKLPPEKVFLNLDKYGNTSSASIPIALDEAKKNNKIKKNDVVLIVAFGAGLTMAASVIKW